LRGEGGSVELHPADGRLRVRQQDADLDARLRARRNIGIYGVAGKDGVGLWVLATSGASERRLAVVIPVSLLIILGLLYTLFASWRDALMVLAILPFGAIGGVLSLLLTGTPFSISAAVGFTSALGVGTLGGCVFLSGIRRVERSAASALGQGSPAMPTREAIAISLSALERPPRVGSAISRLALARWHCSSTACS